MPGQDLALTWPDGFYFCWVRSTSPLPTPGGEPTVFKKLRSLRDALEGEPWRRGRGHRSTRHEIKRLVPTHTTGSPDEPSSLPRFLTHRAVSKTKWLFKSSQSGGIWQAQVLLPPLGPSGLQLCAQLLPAHPPCCGAPHPPPSSSLFRCPISHFPRMATIKQQTAACVGRRWNPPGTRDLPY